ncbi:MAG: hypothetical protein O3A20_07600 [Planctomycetota bacterium]|nr:hypothetical protein [Planctomycetota bacterium]
MLARLSLLCALLPAACASADPFPLSGGGQGALTSEGYWLARADDAEARSDFDAALLSLERWERDFPERADRAYFERRLRLADAAGNDESALAARRCLLEDSPDDFELRLALADELARVGQPRAAAELLDLTYEDQTERLRAWRRSAGYLEQEGDWGAAAERMELAASDPGAGASAPAWWERASWLWERAGDRPRATRAIELALEGIELGPREAAALARLRAFELGEIHSVEDARAALRFHTDPDLRLSAARFLAARRFNDEISIFGRALSDPDERVVAVSLEQLAVRFAATERAYVASLARGLIGDARQAVRVEAIVLLGASGEMSDVPLLLEALDPADRSLFRAAHRALQTLTGEAQSAPDGSDIDDLPSQRERWTAWWKTRGEPR